MINVTVFRGPFGDPADPKADRLPPTVLTGKWNADFTAKTRTGAVPINIEVGPANAEVGVIAALRHDGTNLFTWQLISAVTETAEKYAAEQPEAWEMSLILLWSNHLSGAEHPAVNYGWGAQDDTALAYMRKVDPTSPTSGV